jgi:hypothetical protein
MSAALFTWQSKLSSPMGTLSLSKKKRPGMLLIENKAPNTHSNMKRTHLEIAMTTKKSSARQQQLCSFFHMKNKNPRLSVVSPNGTLPAKLTDRLILPIEYFTGRTLFIHFIHFIHFQKMSDVVVEPDVTIPLQVNAPEKTEVFDEQHQFEKKKRNSSFVAARASFTNSIEQQKHRGSITALPAGPHSPNGHFRLRSSFTEHSPSPSSSQNKNWEQEILSQRKIGSVKDISSRFKGNSKIETMAAYEQRIRGYKNLKTINYFRLQNQDLKFLSLKNKIKIMNELKAMYLSNEKMGKLTTEAAKEFLSHHDLSAENLSQEQWNEWLEVIENTVKEAAQERAAATLVASSASQEEPSNGSNSPLVLPIVSHDSLDNFDDEKEKEGAPGTPTTQGDSKFNSLQELHVINSNNNRPAPLLVNHGEEEKNNKNNPNPNNNNNNINNQEISHSHYWSNSFLSPSKKTEFDSGILDKLLFDEEQKKRNSNDENNENEKKELERERESEREQEQDDDRETVVRNPLTGSRIGTNLEEKKVHSSYRDSLSSTPPSSPPRSPLRENKKEMISSSLSYQSVEANNSYNNKNNNNNNSHNNSSSSLLSASPPRSPSPSPSPQVTSKPAFVPLSVANRSSEADYHEMDNNGGNGSKKKKSPGIFFCCFRS